MTWEKFKESCLILLDVCDVLIFIYICVEMFRRVVLLCFSISVPGIAGFNGPQSASFTHLQFGTVSRM